MSEDVTPIRQQYLDIKRQNPDAILFFRLGDFYETFDEDAQTTSRELDLVLTSRPVAKGVRVPMAGIPYHAAENYLARLISKGYHVAICEQIGVTPVKGLFPREVIRTVTPGTLIEPGLLQGAGNNFLAALVRLEERAGLAFTDITTGEFQVTELSGESLGSDIRAELMRLHPAELLLAENGDDPPAQLHSTRLPAWRFEPARCSKVLMDHFQTATLDGFGLRNQPLAVRAAGVILQYLAETQPAALKLITGISTYHLGEFMVLDAATRRNLELTETIRGGTEAGSLLAVLDSTVTPMGKRLIRQWVSKPLLDRHTILHRQNGVRVFIQDGLVRSEFKGALREVSDIERLTNRVLAGSALPRDLVALRASLEALPAVLKVLARLKPETEGQLELPDPYPQALELLSAGIADEPPATLQSSGVIRRGHSAELDQVIEASQHAREWISSLEAVERERTGIRTLKVGYNKVFGYYIEITRAKDSGVPAEYIRKQTLVNAERYITPEMKEYEALVLNAEERIREIEQRLFRELCLSLASFAPRLLGTARVLAELDTLASLAEAAAYGGYVAPELVSEPLLDIEGGRHPVVEQNLHGERFVPNDTSFEEGEFVRLITGPNMSGKSTFLRQTALIVLMAQIGSFVPAQSARIGLVDRIFTRIGAQDEIHAGQSTFMVEMVETADILNHATRRSLLILDEIGRGTSTYDGVSIAWAVVEYIHNNPELRARTLFATHYHELTQLAEILPGVRNYNVAVSEGDGKVVFLHRILPGGADRSYGIHVGQLAGLPRPVIQRAHEILGELEKSSGRAVKLNPDLPQQMALFPDTNPLRKELEALDVNALTPIEAINKLYEWRRRFLDDEGK